MKTFICVVAFRVSDSLIEKSISDVHSVRFHNGNSYETQSIAEFIKNRPNVERYINVFGENTFLDFKYRSQMVYIEFR